MAKELTFSEATLGWRFAHTEIFLKHFIKQWELLQDVQIKNLDEYWNINAATGTWLNQLGEIFDTARVQTLGENAFMLNVSQLNDPDSRLNGRLEDVADELFRKIILLRSLSVNKLFSMKNIAEDLYEVFGRDQIKVEFRENTDNFDNYKAQYFRILLTFKDSEMIRMFGGMQKTHPMLFIGKPMGVSYHIYVSWDPDLGDNANAILCGNATAVDAVLATYTGTDSSINNATDCYSYDREHFTMYYPDTVISRNFWTPIYKYKNGTGAVAYIRPQSRLLPLGPDEQNSYTTNAKVYFPLLGETQSDARDCFVIRSKIQE